MQRCIQMLLRMVIGIGVVLFLAVTSPVLQSVSAVNFFPTDDPNDPCGVNPDAVACSGRDDNITGTDGIILQAAGLIAIVAGVAAVMAIIVGGVMFITAAGDSSKISTAKKTIAYAVVGLIIIFLARTIVAFVVRNV